MSATSCSASARSLTFASWERHFEYVECGVGADAVDVHQHALCLFDGGSVVGDFG
jgi:hypothetical protein